VGKATVGKAVADGEQATIEDSFKWAAEESQTAGSAQWRRW
jgi:hypothetical protein